MTGLDLGIPSSKGHTVSTVKMSFSCLIEYSKVYVCDYNSINILFQALFYFDSFEKIPVIWLFILWADRI